MGKFQRDVAAQARIFRLIDDSHAPASDLGEDAIGAGLPAPSRLLDIGERCGGERLDRQVQDAPGLFVGGDQAGDFALERRVAGAGLGQPGGALGGRALKSLIKQRFHAPP